MKFAMKRSTLSIHIDTDSENKSSMKVAATYDITKKLKSKKNKLVLLLRSRSATTKIIIKRPMNENRVGINVGKYLFI